MAPNFLQFACIDCGHRFDAQGNCTRCKTGPLMDLKNPDVRQSLLQEDDVRRGKRRSLAIWLSVPVAGLAMLVLGGGIIGIGLGGGIGYASSLAIAAVFPARQLFPYLKS